MKKRLSGIFVLLVLVVAACNSRQEEPVAVHKDYMHDAVGMVKSGAYHITNLEVIKTDWKAKLLKASKGAKLVDFRIEKGVTTGDKSEDYYILIARSADKKLKAASLLELKGDNFYLQVNNTSAHGSYGNIVCVGDCIHGCDPTVSSYDGTKYLNCSPCADCVKNESEMH